MANQESARQILICDDDLTFQLLVRRALSGALVSGFPQIADVGLQSAHNGDEALSIVKRHAIEAIFLDIQMRSPDEGLRYIPALKELNPEIAIVMISSATDFQTVREAMRLGACDYLPKDFDANTFLQTVERVLERKKILKRSTQKSFELELVERKHVLLGQSQGMKRLQKTIERMKASDGSVVITGETGTGKELVARQLRKTLDDGTLAPFISVDSSTIQSTMAESLLFGHEKGAFTGADRTVKGIFEEADGGIVYFDEISNMPLSIQAKLLRVLQEKEVVRVGASRPIQLEFRVICATNRNLEEMVRNGEFKEDLFQRLNVLPIEVPPLRERTEDIPLLIEHFMRGIRLRFTDEAVQQLQRYRWPGNVRELGNLIAYVAALVERDEVEISDLPPRIRDVSFPRVGPRTGASEASSDTFYDRVGRFERELLSAEYQKAGGNISKLALGLGMDRSHLYTKLKEHGIHPKRTPS